MRGHAVSNSRKFNRHWQSSGISNKGSIEFIMSDVSMPSFTATITLNKIINIDPSGKTISHMRLKSENIPVYSEDSFLRLNSYNPNTGATAGLSDVDGIMFRAPASGSTREEYFYNLRCAGTVPVQTGDFTTGVSVQLSPYYDAVSHYAVSGTSREITPMSGKFLGVAGTFLNRIYQYIENDFEYIFDFDNPITIEDTGTLLTNSLTYAFLNSGASSADKLAWLQTYINRFKLVVELW